MRALSSGSFFSSPAMEAGVFENENAAIGGRIDRRLRGGDVDPVGRDEYDVVAIGLGDWPAG